MLPTFAQPTLHSCAHFQAKRGQQMESWQAGDHSVLEVPACLALIATLNRVYQAHALITIVAMSFLCICVGGVEGIAHRDKHHVCALQGLLDGRLTFIGSSLHCEHCV